MYRKTICKDNYTLKFKLSLQVLTTVTALAEEIKTLSFKFQLFREYVAGFETCGESLSTCAPIYFNGQCKAITKSPT